MPLIPLSPHPFITSSPQLKLVAHQRVVGAAARHKLVVGARLRNAPPVEHDDVVGVAHRREAVGDNHHRPPPEELPEAANSLCDGLPGRVEVPEVSESYRTSGSVSECGADLE